MKVSSVIRAFATAVLASLSTAASPGNGFSHIRWVGAAVIHRLRKGANP